jgi:hypothetical protein
MQEPVSRPVKFEVIKWQGGSYMVTHMYAFTCRVRHVDSGKSLILRYEWIEQENPFTGGKDNA